MFAEYRGVALENSALRTDFATNHGVNMKKTMMALAAVLVAGGAAAAESNVTIYGVADVNVGRTSSYSYTGFDLAATGKNGQIGLFEATRANQIVVDSSGLSDSRIGLRVNEDLGNGNMGFAIFENGVNLDTGAGAGSRTTVVGLKSAFGTFSVGRQASPYHDTFSAFSAQNDSRFDAAKGGPISVEGMVAIAAFRAYINANNGPGLPTDPNFIALQASALAATNANNLSGSTGAWVGHKERVSNSIRYDSPDFNGFSGSAVIGLGENREPGAKASYDAGFSIKYENGPMALTLAHQTEASKAQPNPYITIVPAGRLVKLSNTLLAGSYDFGTAKLYAGFNLAKYNITGVKTQKELLLGGSMPLGATTLVAQYARSQGDSLDKSHSFGAEAQYALSKRSTAYVGANVTNLPSYKNSAVGVGLRHVF